MRALLATMLLLPWACTAVARAQDAASADGESAEGAEASPETAPSEAGLGELEAMLDESVVTTPSRSAERASTAPATVFTITAAEIRTYGIRTVAEALELLGIGMQTTSTRDYLSGGDVGANGLLLRDRGRHVLVLLDGQVMNASDTGAIELHEGFGVPLEAIDHIEVMLGAGSVMYGSNAMLAVVHVVTRSGEPSRLHATAEVGLLPPTDEAGQPTVPGPGESAGLRYRLGLGFTHAFRLFGSPAELSLRGEWLEEIRGTMRTPEFTADWVQRHPDQLVWGGIAHDGLRAPSVVASLRVGDFRLQVQLSHYDRPMPLVGTFDDPLAREEHHNIRVQLRHETLLDAHVSLTTRLYAGMSDWGETNVWTSPYWCVPGQVDGCLFSARSRGRWAGLEQQLSVDWTLDGTVATTVGYDVRGRDATMRPGDGYDLRTGAAPLTTRMPYSHSVSALGAVFLQQVWQPVPWLLLNGGARLDIDGLFGARLSPRLSATLLPVEGTTVRLAYSEAFRAPSAYELGEYDPTYRVRAHDLGPEVSRVIEVEWQQRIEWLTFSLRAFAAFYEGFIQTRVATPAEAQEGLASGDIVDTADPTYLVRWDNLDTLRSIGGSLTLSMRPVDGLVIAGSVTVADTRRNEVMLPLVPLWMANARVAYAFERDGATIALVASMSGRRLASADWVLTETVEIAEQAVLRATFSSPLPGVPGLALRVGASYAVNPLSPVLLDGPSEDAPTSAPVRFPGAPSFFGFVGLQYDLDV